jgi:hypothetical protein
MNRRVFLAWIASFAAVDAVGASARQTVARDVELPPIKTPTGEDRMHYLELYRINGSVAVKVAERWPHETEWRYDRSTWRDRYAPDTFIPFKGSL